MIRSTLCTFLLISLATPALASTPPKGVPTTAKFHARAKVWVLQKGRQQLVWHQNGVPRSVGDFVNRRREGDYKFYHANGQIEASGKYQNHQKIGIWQFHHKDGSLKARGLYQNNRRNGEWNFYFPGGKKLAYKGQYVNGRREGEWSNYYQSGKLFYQGVYKNDQAHGSWQYFFKGGQLYQKGRYRNGVRYGAWTICIQPGQCQTQTLASGRTPRRSNIGSIVKTNRVKDTSNPAAVLESLDTGGVPDQVPSNLKKNPWRN